MTTIERELRHRAADYVSGRSTLSELEIWLGPVAWSLDETADKHFRELVNALELRIAEYTSGAWSDEQIRELIENIAVPPSASLEYRLRPAQEISVSPSFSSRTEALAVAW